MSNPIPERLINFQVYSGGNKLLGVATIELPDIEAMSDTTSGAGIAGEIESPILGHFGSMATTITFRTMTKEAAELNAPVIHAIEARGSQQVHDEANGRITTSRVRVAMRCKSKRFALGSFEVGSTTDTEKEFEVTYLKLEIDNQVRLEIDKLNFKFVVNGVDYLAQVRDDLGL